MIAATAAGAALAESGLDLCTDLVFGLVEGVVLVHRSDPERPVPEFARAAAAAALRIAGARDTPPKAVGSPLPVSPCTPVSRDRMCAHDA